jgi:pantetheine-phosphate adenylyltransferase
VRTVIYPGSFDPLTNGHLDVIQRAARLFDRVVVAVARNGSKQPLFPSAERKAMIVQATTGLANVSVDIFEGLLVEYVEQQSGHAVIRGLRALSDFEYEFQMALMNRKLNENIETLFMMPRASYSFLSSHLVKEIAGLGGDVSPFVTPEVREALAAKRA